jgi:hypothetical protein
MGVTEMGTSSDNELRNARGEHSSRRLPKELENVLAFALVVLLLVGAFLLLRLLFPGVVAYLEHNDSSGDAAGALLLAGICGVAMASVLIWSAVKVTLRKTSRLLRRGILDRLRKP